MSDSSKIPMKFLWSAAITRPVGSGRDAFELKCMRIDAERNGWIDPFSRPVAKTISASGEAVLDPKQKVVYLERVEGGFRVDLTHAGGSPWTVGPKPDAVGEVEWIPVVEFIVPEPEPKPEPV
jgi:hypothetical protein